MRKLNEKELVNLLVEANLIEDVESATNVHINEYDNTMAVDSLEGDFVIYADYDDAEYDAIERCKEIIIEDCGLSDDLMNIAYNHGFIDEEWFKDFWIDVHYNQAYEEGIHYIALEYELEQLEAGEITEEEIRDSHFDRLQASIGDAMEEYRYQFGEQELYNTLKYHELVNIEELSKYCVDVDGVASFIASYDHEEIEHDGYYIYRTN